jgi:cytidylate kinase
MKVPDITIAIDGYSSTGKSSFAKLIAKDFGFLYLDSGAMYRAVTLFAMEEGLIAKDGTIDTKSLIDRLSGLDIHFVSTPDGSHTFIGGRDVEKEIRTLEVSNHVSPVSAIPEVRDYVDEKLRAFGKNGGIVMDGRDIGTTVFPNAELKIFMTADPEVRARRRYDEMRSKGQNPDIEDVRKNLQERDYIDSHRKVSPLKKADDAIVLDNSKMTFDDQMDWIRTLVKEKFPSPEESPASEKSSSPNESHPAGKSSSAE